jgi:hypothetical protein
MIFKNADIKKLGSQKFLFGPQISHTKNLRNPCTLNPATKNVNFPHFVWKQTKSLKT